MQKEADVIVLLFPVLTGNNHEDKLTGPAHGWACFITCLNWLKEIHDIGL